MTELIAESEVAEFSGFRPTYALVVTLPRIVDYAGSYVDAVPRIGRVGSTYSGVFQKKQWTSGQGIGCARLRRENAHGENSVSGRGAVGGHARARRIRRRHA
jgi:hypothetical protein